MYSLKPIFIRFLCVWWGVVAFGGLACQNRLKQNIKQKEQAIDSLKQKIDLVQTQKVKLVWEHAKAKYAFQGCILVASKGKVLLKEAHGFANLYPQTRLQTQTLFPIASLTQGFMATAVLQLAERGKLSVLDKVTKYYPNFPYPEATVVDLLWQTSGIPDYLTTFYTPQNQPLTHAYKQNVIAWLLENTPKPRFPVQEAQAMSSTNYVLLADIVEKVSDVSLSQYLEENIWKPLDMRHTYLKEPKKNYPAPRATGYSLDLKELADESYVDFVYGDCGLQSNLDDLYKWEQSLYKEQVLSKIAIEQFGKLPLLKSKRTAKYSMGWFVEQEALVQRGNWLGFKAYLAHNPTQNYTVIILNNNQNPKTHTLGDAMQAVLKGENYKLPE